MCCVGMVSVMSKSRYVTSASRYQSRSSMYIPGLIPWNWLRQLIPIKLNLDHAAYQWSSKLRPLMPHIETTPLIGGEGVLGNFAFQQRTRKTVT